MSVVDYYVSGPKKAGPTHTFTATKLVKLLATGLPTAELSALQQCLDLPAEQLAPMLGISKATFHRHKAAGKKLDPAVSDRVVRYARLVGRAAQVLGDIDDAKRWLNSPQFGLGGQTPIDYAKSEFGAREVENLLGRIEHGVYS